MVHTLDHFMYAGHDLVDLNNRFTALTGVKAVPGGHHPLVGTHNSLIGLQGATAYMELFAPDPNAVTDSAMRRSVASLTHPQLHRIILKAQAAEFPALIQAYAQAGIEAKTQRLQRNSADGTVLHAPFLIPEVEADGVFFPLFMDWLDIPHSATHLHAEITVLGFDAGHPDAERLTPLWHALGMEITLLRSDVPYFHVHLDTPRGGVVLT